MTPVLREDALATAQSTICLLQRELAETNHGLMVLSMELEQRLEERNEINAVLRREITERQRAEAEVRQLNGELERRVAERTDQLQAANEGLQRARESADRANQAKSEFISRMNHELRTPLNSILGFAQLLERQQLGEPSQRSLGYILKAGHHLLKLIDEILDLARIEAGRLPLALESVGVQEAVQETLDLIRPLADQRKVRVEADLAALRAHFVLADFQRFKQVLLNLVGNAVKYNCQAGCVTITCQAVPAVASPESGNSLLAPGMRACRVNIHDTGRGIPVELQSRLFQPFDRLEAERTDQSGSGLGLVLAKRMVESMHGCIGFQSAAGQGSTFWIELPAAPCPKN